MRLAFFGSPDFAVPALDALHGAGHRLEAVYTQPPRASGRGQRLTRCAVHARADALGLTVRTPSRLKPDAECEAFEALGLDGAVVAAYGLILPARILDAPRRGCLNIHASLLPRWRGAAPIQAALLAGDAETGISIMRMDVGLDTGPVLMREAIAIGPRDTARDLHDRLAPIGGRLVLRALAEAPAAVEQPTEGITYAGKLGRDDADIDWTRDSDAIDRQIRALTPWPGTRTLVPAAGDATVLKIIAAHPVAMSGTPGEVLDDRLTIGCGSGALRLDIIQSPGRAPMDVPSFLRGQTIARGTVLGTGR